MKPVLRVLLLFVLTSTLCFQSVHGCSLSIPPLRKEFREAKLVFAGRITNIKDRYLPTEEEIKNLPDYWPKSYRKKLGIFSKVSVEVVKKWKGNISQRVEFVTVIMENCECEDFRKLNENEEYLVFTANKSFFSVCDADPTQFDGTKEKMKRLDSFWFRVWARIYPF